MWVRFGRDDRAKPQEYSKYFEDFRDQGAVEDGPQMGCEDGSYSFAGP